MRRPLPNRVNSLEKTGAPSPSPTQSSPGYHGWQLGCATDTPTAACVSIGTSSDTVVDASQCPPTQDAAGETLAHEHGLFGMLDGINATSRTSACANGGPRSFYVARGSCQGGYNQIECTQAFVNAAGEATAKQLSSAYNCAAQAISADFQAFVASPAGEAIGGGSYIPPDMVYSSWGATCAPDTPSTTKRVTAGQCSGDGGYVCTSFDVAKSASGQYSVTKATPTDANQCNGNANPVGGETDFIKSLGYYAPNSYGSPAAYCANYDTFGASSTCQTTVKQRLDGGYDINTGLDVQCFGLAPNAWNPSYITSNSVAVNRCESAGTPSAAQLQTIAAAGLVPYEQAKNKDCGLAANIDYNFQWKVLPGNWNVRRGTATYEYPTAATRAKKTPREGDQYGEYTDWTYEGTFNLSTVCTDIVPNDTQDSYWDGPYDSSFYQQNHTTPIESKTTCSLGRDLISQPYYYLDERVLPSVGETWGSEPRCYEPSYGMKDKTAVAVSGNGAILTLNRCSPAKYRFFTYRNGAWQPGQYSLANAQR